MNEQQQNKVFFELAAQYESLVEQIKNVKEQMQSAMSDIGVNKMVQDTDGTVYQIVVPKGHYVYYEPITYIRTRKINEDRGELSLKKAEEAGFSLAHLKK